MEDARRFLRYITPGLVFIIEVFIYLFIVNISLAIKLFNTLSKNQGWLTLFVISGGIGFLLSIFHHTIYWTLWNWLKLSIDHRKMLINAQKNKFLTLKFQQYPDSLYDVWARSISKIGAWRIFINIWNTKKVTSKRIEGANWTMDNLSDIMHGAGTNFIGSIIASLLLWGYIIIYKPQLHKLTIFLPNFFILVIRVSLLLLCFQIFLIFIHFINFKRCVINAQSFADMILYQELKIEHSRKKEHEEPIEVIIKTNADTILHQELKTEHSEKKETKESKEPVEVIITSRELKLRLRVGNSLQKLINKI